VDIVGRLYGSLFLGILLLVIVITSLFNWQWQLAPLLCTLEVPAVLKLVVFLSPSKRMLWYRPIHFTVISPFSTV
jgi:hypothetical protein